MLSFLTTLKSRNSHLYYFGWLCLFGAGACIFLLLFTNTQVLGINAWIKPFKFFLSTVIFVWTMGWILLYLHEEKKALVYTWVVIAVLAFELIYIVLQAGKGHLSHFNISDPFHGMMFSLMGIAISAMTIWTGYIGYLFFVKSFPHLPQGYVWGIRLGILLFVLFAFEGGVMAAKLSHTVGAPDGGNGLPLVNWSTGFGDLRVAHFFGMHSLQLLPLISFYLALKPRTTIIISAVYFLLNSILFIQALAARPFISF